MTEPKGHYAKEVVLSALLVSLLSCTGITLLVKAYGAGAGGVPSGIYYIPAIATAHPWLFFWGAFFAVVFFTVLLFGSIEFFLPRVSVWVDFVLGLVIGVSLSFEFCRNLYHGQLNQTTILLGAIGLLTLCTLKARFVKAKKESRRLANA